MKLETTKGSYAGSEQECSEWLNEHQPSHVSVVIDGNTETVDCEPGEDWSEALQRTVTLLLHDLCLTRNEGAAEMPKNKKWRVVERTLGDFRITQKTVGKYNSSGEAKSAMLWHVKELSDRLQNIHDCQFSPLNNEHHCENEYGVGWNCTANPLFMTVTLFVGERRKIVLSSVEVIPPKV